MILEKWARAGLKKPWIWAAVKIIFITLSCSSHWNSPVYFHMWIITFCCFYLARQQLGLSCFLASCYSCPLQRKIQVLFSPNKEFPNKTSSVANEVNSLCPWLTNVEENVAGAKLMDYWFELFCVSHLFASINKQCIYFLTVLLCFLLIIQW